MAYHFLVGNGEASKVPEIVIDDKIIGLLWVNNKVHLYFENMKFEKDNVSFNEYADLVNILRYNANIYIRFDRYIEFKSKED